MFIRGGTRALPSLFRFLKSPAKIFHCQALIRHDSKYTHVMLQWSLVVNSNYNVALFPHKNNKFCASWVFVPAQFSLILLRFSVVHYFKK